jgi:PAS domain S-box-containing protein
MKQEKKPGSRSLRQKAESLLKDKSPKTSSQLSETETLKLIHELEVHQLELELQNEELRLSKDRAELAADKYTVLYDFAPSGYFTLSQSGAIIELNLKASQMLGKHREHLINRPLGFFISDLSIPIFNIFLQKVFFGKTTETCEIILSSDINLPVYLHFSGIADKSKEKCLVTAVDITDYKRAEAQLLMVKKAVESASDAIGISDTSGRHIYHNRALSELFGFATAEELEEAGGGMARVRDPEVAKEIFENIKRGLPWSGELEMVTKTGRIFPAYERADAITDSKGDIVGLIGVISDITGRKQAEETLRSTNEFNRSLLQTIPFGMHIVDGEGNVLFLSDTMKQGFGEGALGKKCWELYRDDKKQCSHCPLHSGITIGETKTYETNGVLGGKTFEIYHTGMMFNGQKAILEAFIDITDRKLAELELLKAKEHAEESDHLKSAFLANMSHEIRTPMNGVLGFAELLKEPKLSGEEQEKYISVIQRSGTRLLHIINDIIDISKIEAGQMGANISVTNVNEKIEDIYNFFRQKANQKGIHFSCKSPLPSIQSIIKTDNEKLYAILTNLVNNAIKFTHSGSIEFGYTKKDEFLEFFVKDTGIGVSSAQKKIIFERFRQGGKQLTRTFEGTGLGLSISKAYVKMLGGKIWVDSEEGQGSAFYFTIPYLTENRVQTNNPDILQAKEGSGHIKNLKILIAEDDETSDFLISSILRNNNHELFHAATGAEAIEECRNNQGLDLVLMDIRMPDISGLEATRLIRQFNKSLIIIAQTAYALAGDREKALEAGCNDYIAKPINKDELEKLIQQHLKTGKLKIFS